MTADDIVIALATIPVVCAALSFALAVTLAAQRPVPAPTDEKE